MKYQFLMLDASGYQPSEAVMQAQTAQREQALLPSVLPPASPEDVATWNAWKAAHLKQNPAGPAFAPPTYIAYANAKYQPAVGTAYRFEVQYEYDTASGALIGVENAQTGFVYWQAPTSPAPVDAFGHLLAWTDGNNVSTVMGYDAATGAPVGIGTGPDSAPFGVQSLVYTWDGYGNLEQRQAWPQTSQQLTENFNYDDLNRLGGSTVTNPQANGPTLGMKYDSMGNIHKRTVNGVINTYTYDPNHPYAVDTVQNSSGTTVYSASYDNNGNMITRNGYAIGWTVDNLPESIASATGSSTFSYGPDHDRYYQSATFNSVTTDTTYIGGLFEVISSTGSTEYRHNIVANGQVIAVHTITSSGTATTSYLHYDHLGSVDTITDDNGTIIQSQSMSFDAFGLRRDASNWDYDLTAAQIALLKNNTDRGYTDQEQLDNVGLIHMNGRVYDPTIGRFISPDPTIPKPANGQAFNRYSYVYNSPLIYIDPRGYGPTDNLTGLPTGQEVQDLYEQNQAQMNPENQLAGDERAAGQILVGGTGILMIAGGVALLAAPGGEPAGPVLIGSGVAEFTAADAGTAFLNSAAVTVALTQGSTNLFTSLTDNSSVDLLDLAFGPGVGDALSASVSAWDWANILGKPKAAQTISNYLTEGANFLKNLFSPPKKTSPPSNGAGGGGGGSGPNMNPGFGNLAPVTCTYTWYDYYSSDGKYEGSGPVSVECD